MPQGLSELVHVHGLVTTRVSHKCQGRSIEAAVETNGRYWWGFIDGVMLTLAIPRCPLCGGWLPQPVGSTVAAMAMDLGLALADKP